MKYFLTSLPFNSDGSFNPANRFCEYLKQALDFNCDCLFIAADPNDHKANDFMAKGFQNAFAKEGIHLRSMGVLDGRNVQEAHILIQKHNLLILSGGHVPTQHAFFTEIHLTQELSSYKGVLIGISAGSMNACTTVYAQPELPGEATSNAFPHFLNGLGLTQAVLLPHYQTLLHEQVDGLRVIEDITVVDSMEHPVLCLCDGSYLYGENGKEQLFGECYLIHQGQTTRVDQNPTIQKGDLFQHYKGHIYRIVAIAKHSETLDEMVIYQEEANTNNVWARPISMWNETVIQNGMPVTRFKKIQ